MNDIVLYLALLAVALAGVLVCAYAARQAAIRDERKRAERIRRLRDEYLAEQKRKRRPVKSFTENNKQ